MRPWRRVYFQLQITISKDPGKAGSAKALLHAEELVIQVPSTAIVAGGGLREGVVD